MRKDKALQKRKEIEEKLRQMLQEYTITKFQYVRYTVRFSNIQLILLFFVSLKSIIFSLLIFSTNLER
jgi:hypothetical protein